MDPAREAPSKARPKLDDAACQRKAFPVAEAGARGFGSAPLAATKREFRSLTRYMRSDSNSCYLGAGAYILPDMKAHVFPVILLAGLLAGCATQTETRKAEHETPYHRPLTSLGAKFGALPPTVQATVLAEAGSTDISDAIRDTSSGRVVYKITFRDPDVFPPLYVAPDGSVLNPDLTVAVAAARGTTLKAADVPKSVMKVIEEHGGTSGYKAIYKETWGDRVVYNVTFKDEAHYPRIFIADDGTIVQETLQ
jgi:hypothetical protein